MEVPARLRPNLQSDRPDMDQLLSALVDLNMSASAIAKQGAAISLLALGLSPDGILAAETKALNSSGQMTSEASVPAHSIAVVNLGTSVLTVTNSGIASAPPQPGRGTLKLLPGHSVCTPLIGQSHAFYGRPGELVTVVRYKTMQPFAMGSVGGSYFAFPLTGLAVGTPVTYSTPWGDNAYYGGLAVKDTAGAAGTPDTSELVIADSNGVVLDEVNLAGKESTEDSHTNPTRATSNKIVVTLNVGAVAGMLRVW